MARLIPAISCNDLVITIMSRSPMKHDFVHGKNPKAASALGEVSKSGSAFAVSWSQRAQRAQQLKGSQEIIFLRVFLAYLKKIINMWIC